MKKNTINHLVDTLMFILMMAIIGIGFLMKYVLLSGQERWMKYGANVEMSFWGLDKHQWGTVHLIIGLVLFSLLVLHIILHWKGIVLFFTRTIPKPTIRYPAVTILVTMLVFLLAFPLFVNPEMGGIEGGYGKRQAIGSNRSQQGYKIVATITEDSSDEKSNPGQEGEITIPAVPEEEHEPEHKNRQLREEVDIRGYMSLSDVSNEYGISLEDLRTGLRIPSGISGDERLGRLRNQYGITMSDVRDVIQNNR